LCLASICFRRELITTITSQEDYVAAKVDRCRQAAELAFRRTTLPGLDEARLGDKVIYH
jgi:hypothetical protein